MPSNLNIILGRPTDTSVTASVLGEAGTDVSFEYGTASGSYTSQTPVLTTSAGGPTPIEFTNLAPNTRYYYRARYRPSSESNYRADVEHSFHTQRRPGSTFSFGVQGDSHPERAGTMFNADLYAVNMRNAAARQPDFYVALGDDFSIEKLIDQNNLTQENVDQVYRYQRTSFGLLGDRYNTPYRNTPIFAGRARVTYFPLPAPDGFYSGDTMQVPGVGLVRDYYAFEWGDALFVVIDPYWHSPVPVDNGVPGVEKTKDAWEATIGHVQMSCSSSLMNAAGL